MALTGRIWPQFIPREGCQTKATCVTGFREAQSTPRRSINAIRAALQQRGASGSPGSRQVEHATDMAGRAHANNLTVA